MKSTWSSGAGFLIYITFFFSKHLEASFSGDGATCPRCSQMDCLFFCFFKSPHEWGINEKNNQPKKKKRSRRWKTKARAREKTTSRARPGSCWWWTAAAGWREERREEGTSVTDVFQHKQFLPSGIQLGNRRRSSPSCESTHLLHNSQWGGGGFRGEHLATCALLC